MTGWYVHIGMYVRRFALCKLEKSSQTAQKFDEDKLRKNKVSLHAFDQSKITPYIRSNVKTFKLAN